MFGEGAGGDVYSRRESAASHALVAGTREPPAGKNMCDGGGN
jgi:hypothetical protein